MTEVQMHSAGQLLTPES